MKVENRYQVIKINFFKIIRDRKLHITEAFLLVYLRGLAVFYQSPKFEWSDKQIIDDLRTNKQSLSRWRAILQEKGLIDYKTNHSRFITTNYTMLDTVVADIKDSYTKKQCPTSGTVNLPVSQNNSAVSHKRNTLYNKRYEDIKEPAFKDIAKTFSEARQTTRADYKKTKGW